MHNAVWVLLVITSIFLPRNSLQNPYEGETQVDEGIMVRKLQNGITELKQKLTAHKEIFENLDRAYGAIELQNSVNNFTTMVDVQKKAVYDLEDRLAKHEKSITDALSNQEKGLSRLEPELSSLEKQWQKQSSELEQLKQLWVDLGNSSVARAAEVASLQQTISSLQEGLNRQREKIEDKELQKITLDGALEEAEESLRTLQDSVEEALNTQGRLEGRLTTLQKQIADALAAGVQSQPLSPSLSGADSLCSRFKNN